MSGDDGPPGPGPALGPPAPIGAGEAAGAAAVAAGSAHEEAGAAVLGGEGGTGAGDGHKGIDIARLAQKNLDESARAHEVVQADWTRLVGAIEKAAVNDQSVADIVDGLEEAFRALDDALGLAPMPPALQAAHGRCMDVLMELKNRLYVDGATQGEAVRKMEEDHEARVQALEHRVAEAEAAAAAAQTEVQELDKEIAETKRKAEDESEAAKKKVRVCHEGLRDMNRLRLMAAAAREHFKTSRTMMTKLVAAAGLAEQARNRMNTELPDDVAAAEALGDEDEDDAAEDDVASQAAPANPGAAAPAGEQSDNSDGEDAASDGAGAESTAFSAGPASVLGNGAIDLYSGSEGVAWEGPQRPTTNDPLIAAMVSSTAAACADKVFAYLDFVGANPCSEADDDVQRFLERFTSRNAEGERSASITKILKSFVRAGLGLSDNSHEDYADIAARLHSTRASIKHRIARRRNRKNEALYKLWHQNV